MRIEEGGGRMSEEVLEEWIEMRTPYRSKETGVTTILPVAGFLRSVGA